MIYIIYIQRFTSVRHLKPQFDLIYINLYNLHLYLLIHLLMYHLVLPSCTSLLKSSFIILFSFDVISAFRPRTTGGDHGSATHVRRTTAWAPVDQVVLFSSSADCYVFIYVFVCVFCQAYLSK